MHTIYTLHYQHKVNYDNGQYKNCGDLGIFASYFAAEQAMREDIEEDLQANQYFIKALYPVDGIYKEEESYVYDRHGNFRETQQT